MVVWSGEDLGPLPGESARPFGLFFVRCSALACILAAALRASMVRCATRAMGEGGVMPCGALTRLRMRTVSGDGDSFMEAASPLTRSIRMTARVSETMRRGGAEAREGRGRAGEECSTSHTEKTKQDWSRDPGVGRGGGFGGVGERMRVRRFQTPPPFYDTRDGARGRQAEARAHLTSPSNSRTNVV